ncbi:MAG: SRPBCC family protein [Candidatus Eremiobacteraeota bacterium]|nr:SRPBCC family protein [Candidatus Eremiobacteraeota bacterium]
MKTYGVSRMTAASPDVVWRLWSDSNNWSRWNSGIRDATVDGPIADGVRGKMTTDRGTTHDVAFHDVREGAACACRWRARLSERSRSSVRFHLIRPEPR